MPVQNDTTKDVNVENVEEVKYSICHDSSEGDTNYVTECNHRFHHECIQEWFNQSQNTMCPICRQFLHGFYLDVTELDLSYKNLRELPTNYFLAYPNLKKLNLYGNKLSSLPESLFTLTNLEILHLNKNKLTVLPPSIGNLTSLKKLTLSCNQLTSLPTSISNLTSLKSLGLSHNQFTSFPDSIFDNLTNLELISLYSNYIVSLPESLFTLPSLNELHLPKNFSNELEESYKQKLSHLHLYFHLIDPYPPYLP